MNPRKLFLLLLKKRKMNPTSLARELRRSGRTRKNLQPNFSRWLSDPTVSPDPVVTLQPAADFLGVQVGAFIDPRVATAEVARLVMAGVLDASAQQSPHPSGLGSPLSASGVIPMHLEWDNVDPGGQPRVVRAVPIVGTARMGDNGFYEELQHPPGYGDGWIDSYSTDMSAYALRVKGDSMHPAIRHGAFVVVEPGGQCVPGEYVVIALTDGRKMVKELVIERPDEVIIESVNGNSRMTIERSQIEQMHPVAAVVAASKWHPA